MSRPTRPLTPLRPGRRLRPVGVGGALLSRGGPLGRAVLRALLLVPLAWIAACASAAEGDAQRLTGCWYFERTEAAEALRLPWGVRLTAEPLDGWPALQQIEGVRVATTLTPEAERDHPFGYWIPEPDGAVEIGYPAGGGLLLELTVHEQRMEGTALPVGDAVLPGEEPAGRSVSLTYARCPGE